MYGRWKRPTDTLVQMTVEEEVEGKTRPGRRERGWIDNIKNWSDGGMAVTRVKARKRMPTFLCRLWQSAAEAAKLTTLDDKTTLAEIDIVCNCRSMDSRI